MGLCAMCGKDSGLPEYCKKCVDTYGFVNDQNAWEKSQREKYAHESSSGNKYGLFDNLHSDDFMKVLLVQNDIIIKLLAQQTIHGGGVLGALFSSISNDDYIEEIEKIKRERKYGND